MHPPIGTSGAFGSPASDTVRWRILGRVSSRPAPFVPDSQAAVLDGLADAIDTVLDAQFDWINRTRWKPVQHSPYWHEARLLRRQKGPGGRWDDSVAVDALGLSTTFLVAMAQNMEALASLLRARQVIVPLPPLCRSLLEAAGRVAWMLEPLPAREGRVDYIDVRIRAARIAAVQLEDYTRMKTVTKNLKHASAPKWGAEVRKLRRDRLPDRFLRLEIDDQDGHLVILKQQLPGLRESADVFERLHHIDWKAGGLYDYLSNSTHSTPHALFELTAVTPEGYRRFELEDACLPCRLCKMAIFTMLHTWGLIAGYIGQLHEVVDQLGRTVAALPES